MAKNTKTFRLSINRTIVSKTRSHGSFVSCKPAWLVCFDISEASFQTKSKVFDHKDLHLRREYYAGDNSHVYNVGLEKAGAEFRLTGLQSFINDSDMTETDDIIVERVEENGAVVFLVDKFVKENYLVLNKYNPDEFIVDGVKSLTRGNDALNTVSAALLPVLLNATNCLNTNGAKADIENAKRLVKSTFTSVDDMGNFIESATEMLGRKVILEFKEQLTTIIASSANYSNVATALADMETEIENLLVANQTNALSQSNIFKKPYGLSNLFWTWDNSIGFDMWDDILNKQMPCTIREAGGTIQKKTVIITEVGTVNIPLGDPRRNQYQSKRLFKIDCLEDDDTWTSFDCSTLLGIERIGNELIFTDRKVAVDYKYFECNVL